MPAPGTEPKTKTAARDRDRSGSGGRFQAVENFLVRTFARTSTGVASGQATLEILLSRLAPRFPLAEKTGIPDVGTKVAQTSPYVERIVCHKIRQGGKPGGSVVLRTQWKNTARSPARGNARGISRLVGTRRARRSGERESNCRGHNLQLPEMRPSIGSR